MFKKISLVLLFSVFLAPTVFTQVPLSSLPSWHSSELGLYSTGMIWRDANNDGYIDVFFSNGNDMNLARNTVYLSHYGYLPASASWLSANYEYSGHCAVGDIDDDGFADFIVANYLGSGRFTTANYANLYFNNNGLLSNYPDWYNADSIYSFSCALGDADGDGDLDIAFATGEGYNNIYEKDLIYYNEGGVFNSSPGWRSVLATAAMDVAWGDVNNDGWLDLAFCFDGQPATIYLNHKGVIDTLPSWQANYNDPSNTLMFGDINADGWLDLVIADNNQLGGSGRFRVYFNDGNGHLNPAYGWQSATGGYGSALALYDFNHDGYDDLATGRWFDYVKIYLNYNGTLDTYPTWQTGLDMVAEELAWIDVDGDGVESRADTVIALAGRKLFYVRHHPLQSIDSVLSDNVILNNNEYCYDLFSGWVSLADAPGENIIIYYKYSFKCDLTVANWDTCNFVFTNTSRPPVDMYAEPSFGWAPLDVQFSDSSQGASNWLWRFSETDSASTQNPSFSYESAGVYDVSLENDQPDGRHNRLYKNMVIVLADTLIAGDTSGLMDSTVTVNINMTNTIPLHAIYIPMEYSGPLNLKFMGYSRTGCRTEAFQHASYLNYNGTTKCFYLSLEAGSAAEMLTGSGTIIKFLFKIQAGPVGSINPLVMDGYDTYEPLNVGYLASYAPALEDGSITYATCCIGYTGNVDCSENEEPDISDITRLIDYLYLSHAPLCCPEEADSDVSGGEPDIADITRLIDFLYLSHLPMAACP
ncbi:MAG: FG-GAP-like repeat-containing protein [candidate division Zixibacteria bacterium]|nr:FG-GAP-like repeat-containing protein [candidate division Zixibacteria bacterium]